MPTPCAASRHRPELASMGYKFQFVTLAGFHALNHGKFELAHGYRARGMTAYAELQGGVCLGERRLHRDQAPA